MVNLRINNSIIITDLIVCFRKGDSWEQITDDSIEQWNVMGEKLWLIYILYRPQDLLQHWNKLKGSKKMYPMHLADALISGELPVCPHSHQDA